MVVNHLEERGECGNLVYAGFAYTAYAGEVLCRHGRRDFSVRQIFKLGNGHLIGKVRANQSEMKHVYTNIILVEDMHRNLGITKFGMQLAAGFATFMIETC